MYIFFCLTPNPFCILLHRRYKTDMRQDKNSLWAKREEIGKDEERVEGLFIYTACF